MTDGAIQATGFLLGFAGVYFAVWSRGGEPNGFVAGRILLFLLSILVLSWTFAWVLFDQIVTGG